MAVSNATSKAPESGLKRSVSPASNGNTSQFTCVVSKDTVVEGTFIADQDVRLDGKVIGDVKCSKRLVMGDTGKIKGTVIAQHAVVMGQVDGELQIKESLHLKSTSVINGKIQAASIVVDEGAEYNGEIRVGSAKH